MRKRNLAKMVLVSLIATNVLYGGRMLMHKK